MVQRQTCAISREVSAGKGATLPTTNRDSVTFHSDYIPPPPTSPQVSARRVRPARWRGPELPGVFRADSAPPIRTTRFRSSQACDPKLWGSPKRHRFDTPTRYIMRASEPRFRSSEALSGAWWQVKDSNFRSFRDGSTDHRLQARDQPKRLTRNNFRAYSPQIADDHRLQPGTPMGKCRRQRRTRSPPQRLSRQCT